MRMISSNSRRFARRMQYSLPDRRSSRPVVRERIQILAPEGRRIDPDAEAHGAA